MRTMSLAIACSVVLSCAAAQQAQPPQQKSEPRGVNQDAQLQKEFLDRVGAYVELRKKVERKLPNLDDSADPKAIHAHKTALFEGLREARSGAQQGELFTPPTRALIRRQIAQAAPTPASAPRAAIRDENPGKINISINGEYPTGVPLPTVPPQVLAALPRLPDEELEFRFVGSRLILLDSRANMIIDYMDRALP